MSMSETATTVCFAITIDNQDFGNFTSCQGLGIQVSIDQHAEGGNNAFTYQLPGRMSFSTVKLTRPVNSNSSALAGWISSMAYGVQNGARGNCTASIQALSASGAVICTWNLDRVVPVSWTGPQFSVDGSQVATETLELAHHGFLGDS